MKAERHANSIIIFGSFGPAQLAFSRSCKVLGIDVYLLEFGDGYIGFDHYSSAIRGQKRYKKSLSGTQLGLQAIMEYVDEIDAKGIITVAEQDLLWVTEHRACFEPKCKVLASSYQSLNLLKSKEKQINLATQTGFKSLPTWYIKQLSDCGHIPKEQFPLCMRPSVPLLVNPSFKAKVIHSPDELTSFVAQFTRISAPIIAQPFLPLPDLKVHGVRSLQGEILALEPFFVERKFEGVTLTLMKAEFPQHLKECCRKFVNLADLTGPFHFDLLYSPQEQRVYYLEINVRMGGITDKALAFGYDQPALVLEAYGLIEKPKVQQAQTSRKRVVNKKAVFNHFLKAVTGQLNELDHPPASNFTHALLSIRDILFARDSVFNWKDLKGSLWFYFQKSK